MEKSISERRNAQKMHKIFPPPITPYAYQIPIIKKIMDTILKGKNGLVIQPTATGKSVESAFVSRSCILLHGMRGLYLYNENEGLYQARNKFEYIFGKNEIICSSFFGTQRDFDVDKADMVFASFQSLNNYRQKWYELFDQNHFDFIIVNEGHHSSAVTYREVLDYFNCSKIAMTAVPKRMDGKDILDIFEEVIFEMTLEESIAKAWVARVEYHICSHGLSGQKLKKICSEVLQEGKRVSIKQLNETIFIKKFNESILEEIYSHAFPKYSDPLQTIIFCENIKHSDETLVILNNDKKSAEVVHSKKTQIHNHNVLEAFKEGKFQFLIAVDKLNEDIDIPNVELAVFLRATDSLTVFLEQLGRVLRRTKFKERAIILDFVANCERLLQVDEMMKKISSFSEGISKNTGLSNQSKTSLEKGLLYVSGEGFNFSFNREVVDVLNLLKELSHDHYATWQEARNSVISLGISNRTEYIENRVKDLRLPSDPTVFYGDFPGWYTFLGMSDLNVPLLLKDKVKLTETIIEILLKNSVTDYWALRYEIDIRTINFGALGKVYNVFSVTIGTTDLTNKTLDSFAKFINWYPSKKEKLFRYKKELKEKGIIDYWSLINFPISKFVKTEFGFFGKGKNFIGNMLGRKGFIFAVDLYDDLAELLEWGLSENQKKEEYKMHFIHNNIKNRADLLKISSSELKKMDFGYLGKGVQFFSLILSEPTAFSKDKVIKVADYLGWIEEKETIEEKIKNCKEELANHGIVDYLTLLKFGTQKFRTKKFKGFGTGYTLALNILEIESIVPRWRIDLDLLADKLGWAMSKKDRIDLAIRELAHHDIFDFRTLLKFGTTKFRSTSFGSIGKGYKLFIFISGKTVTRITKEVLNEFAGLLGWDTLES